MSDAVLPGLPAPVLEELHVEPLLERAVLTRFDDNVPIAQRAAAVIVCPRCKHTEARRTPAELAHFAAHGEAKALCRCGQPMRVQVPTVRTAADLRVWPSKRGR